MQKSFVVCEEPDTPAERIAIIVWHLAHGEGLTTAQVAEITGLNLRGARKLMASVSRVLPVCQVAGTWEVAIFAETRLQ